MQRSGALLLFGAVGAGAYFLLAPRFPRDQTVNVVLGEAASDVTDVSLHYANEHDVDSSRDVTMHFDSGKAPRVIRHETRLVDGDYVITIALHARDRVWSGDRRVALHGGASTSIDVSEPGVRALHENRAGSSVP